MKKCKGCDADCLFCADSPDWVEKIDTKGAFLFWPCVILAVIGLIAWLSS